MTSVKSREDDGLFEDELDFFTLRNDEDMYGRTINRRGMFYDPETGREVRWRKHMYI